MIEHGVLEPICSDHKPIFACLNFSQIRTHSFKRLVWDFRNADFISFRTKLSYMNWDFIDTIDDINIIRETFTNKFMEVAHLTISNKQYVIRTKDKPWMNNEIRKQIRKRHRIHKTAKRVNTMEQWRKFRLQRNRVTSLIRKCKQDYYSRVADNFNSDHRKSTKTLWNLCKYLYTGKTNQNVIPPINFHDNILIDDIDKVEAFNSYFTSISNIANMADNLPDNVTRCASSLDNIHISNQDVIDVIKNLKPNKACGFDQISHILLKESLISLALPISTLFNKSLNLGQFPDIWKMANVLPVFKGKDPSIVNNYRPISLLSCLGKVFERCILNTYSNIYVEII